jgi:hypothetical protein
MNRPQAADTTFAQISRNAATYKIEARDWGYVIKSKRGGGFGLALWQATTLVFGGALAAGALAVIALPLLTVGTVGPMRIGLAVLFGALAIYMLWFGSRGAQSELHVDLDALTISEVMPHRSGPATVIAEFDMGAISSVGCEETDAPEKFDLVVRSTSTDRPLWVARGTLDQLAPLQDQLARDFFGED